MSDPSSQPTRIGELLTSVGRGLGLAHPVEAGRLWARWRDIVGDTLADHAEPTSLRGRVLRVRADSPAWANEIGYLREEIRRRANAAMGKEVVAEIRVWTGPGRTPSRGGPRRREGAAGRSWRAAATDPMEAFTRARQAWARRLNEPR